MSTITLPLHKTYALIQKRKLDYLDGNPSDYSDLLLSLTDNNLDDIFNYQLFLNTPDILSVLRRNIEHYQNNIITIVSPDVFNIYLNNRELLNTNELLELHKYVKSDLPEFVNIVDYEELIEYSGSKDIEENLKTPIYQLIGNINPFNVLHIFVPEFLNSIRAKTPITIRLRNTKLSISLTYEPYDFFDISSGFVDMSKVAKS